MTKTNIKYKNKNYRSKMLDRLNLEDTDYRNRRDDRDDENEIPERKGIYSGRVKQPKWPMTEMERLTANLNKRDGLHIQMEE